MIEVPTHLIPPGVDADILEKLYTEVVLEMCDARLESWSHHKPGTYTSGRCRGPLCRKAHREHNNRRNNGAPPNRLIFDEVLLYFMNQVEMQIRARRSDIADQILLDLTWELEEKEPA